MRPRHIAILLTVELIGCSPFAVMDNQPVAVGRAYATEVAEAIAAASRAPSNVDVQSSSCAALASVAGHGPEFAQVVMNAGGMTMIGAALLAHPSDGVVQGHGCAALSHIAAGGTVCAQAVVDADGAGAVVAALRVHLSNRYVHMSGCAARFRIAAGGTECAQAVVDAGGLGAVVAAGSGCQH